MAPSELLGDGVKVRKLSSGGRLLPEIEGANVLALSKLRSRSRQDGDTVLKHGGVVGVFERDGRVLLGDQNR